LIKTNYESKCISNSRASGIGREFVRAFSALGDVVFVCDIDANALKVLKTEIPGIIIHVCDIAKRTEIEEMVNVAVNALGGIDV
jgi:short-subunit dehydrogenase involved in D-alanine esterification of teichoic acids